MNEDNLVGNPVGEKKMEVLVQWRDRLTHLPSFVLRLTQDEAWQTVARIIKVAPDEMHLVPRKAR